MVDTIRAHSAIQVLFADNTTGAISEQDLRDNVESTLGVVPFVAKTASYIATEDDEVINCDATSAPVTITLPAVATTRVGKKYLIIKSDVSVNAVIADGDGGELLNGATTKQTTTRYSGIECINTGAAWIANAVTGAA